ncbi:hypothetical protein IMX26_16440 [Clostridium sp. 'deep sea']|uniref:hypothetical protein n=1 Tax=Clostridium sp. 'deep sea' TaxID=2779445 RepID=UPI001896874F|nr:hypothetical protein [Clostridium sp. 'deep sea']QOR35028.1 hypothetical protein IMX26_16440 [Clostridium sp. 'deep sea']
MKIKVLLGLLCVIYGLFVYFLTITKPPKLWGIGKIQAFVKVLGNTGTNIFFYIWGTGFIALGVWLFIK